MIANTIYLEHESSNSYRNYPFSEHANIYDNNGVYLATDVFVDAILYPIVKENTKLFLTNIVADSVIVSMENDETLSGTYYNGVIELYDSYNRHAGTLICGNGWEREKKSGRNRSFNGIEFSSAVCCPIVHNGVLRIGNSDNSSYTTCKNVKLVGDDCITPVIEHTNLGNVLSFDVQAPFYSSYEENAVKQVIFASYGDTLFDLLEMPSGNTVYLSAPQLSREDVCWQAHKEDSVSAVVDTCENDVILCPSENIPYKIQDIRICPSEIGSVNILTDDSANYKNSIHISTTEGNTTPQAIQLVEGMSQDDMIEEGSKSLDRPKQSGNGIIISIPGLNNGK